MNIKTTMSIAALVGAAWLAAAPVGYADETTTTTTTTRHTDDGPATIVTAPVRAVGAAVGAVVGAPTDCSKKTVTKTDGDTGDSVSKTTTNCD